MTISEFPHTNGIFNVQVEFVDGKRFYGPIDLLLHLIKLRELPIEKLSLVEVCEQYLVCIEQATSGDNLGLLGVQIDLDLLGDYLVIAATLLSIKSSYLLNEPVDLVLDEDGNLIDPHTELLFKLRAAAVFKDAAVDLSELDFLGIDVFAAPSALHGLPSTETKLIDHSPLLLGKAFRKVLDRLGEAAQRYTITREAVSVMERMLAIVEILQTANEPLEFERLLPELPTRGVLIATFIGLLELCKRQMISVTQEVEFDRIMIGLASEDTEITGLTTEFDDALSGQGPADAAANE